MDTQCSKCGATGNIGWDCVRDKPKRLCRDCAKEVQRASYYRNRKKNIRKQILRDHKITEPELQSLEELSQGVCMICKEPPQSKPLCVDHDHNTGQVRGLLCNRCNTGLGYFKDNPELFERAISYLRKG